MVIRPPFSDSGHEGYSPLTRSDGGDMEDTEQRSRAKSGGLSAIPAENLLIGVPKKGRLHEQCVKLLVEGAGLDYKRPDRVDIAHCKDVPVRSPPAPAPAPCPTRCPACHPRGELPRSPHVAPNAHAARRLAESR